MHGQLFILELQEIVAIHWSPCYLALYFYGFNVNNNK